MKMNIHFQNVKGEIRQGIRPWYILDTHHRIQSFILSPQKYPVVKVTLADIVLQEKQAIRKENFHLCIEKLHSTRTKDKQDCNNAASTYPVANLTTVYNIYINVRKS